MSDFFYFLFFILFLFYFFFILRRGGWNGVLPIYGVESRYSRLYRDTRRVGVRSGMPRHGAVGL